MICDLGEIDFVYGGSFDIDRFHVRDYSSHCGDYDADDEQ